MISNVKELVWAIVALAVAVLIAYGLVLLTPHEAQSETQYSEFEEQLIYLDREAINAAYIDHVKKLYSVWLTDYSQDQPKGLKSMEKARGAFVRAMREIDKREEARPK